MKLAQEVINLCEKQVKLTDTIVLKAIESEMIRIRGRLRDLVTITDIRIDLLIDPKSKTMGKFIKILDKLEKEKKIVSIGNTVGSVTTFKDKEQLARLQK